jgi:hypothetical protein
LGLAVAIALLGPSEALSASPVAGGRYRAAVGHGGSDVDVDVRVASDGREFVSPSAIFVTVGCADDRYGAAEEVDLNGDPPAWRSVRIGRDGRFGLRGRFGERVRGRFVRAGRVVVGSAYVAPSRTTRTPQGCRGAGRFRARLVDRAPPAKTGAAVVCDVVHFGLTTDLRVDVVARGIGCTASRALAREWYRGPDCRVPGSSGPCRVVGFDCAGVSAGELDEVAAYACTRPGSGAARVEISLLSPCLTGWTEGWVANATCALLQSFPLSTLVGPHGPAAACPLPAGADVRCVVPGYACIVSSLPFLHFSQLISPGDDRVFRARCRSDADQHVMVVLEYRFH